jgi:hypothetical protein
MIRNSKLVAVIQRFFLNKKFLIRFYSGFLLLEVIVFCFFGIGRLITVLSQKIQLASDIETTASSLNKKQDDLEKILPTLKEAQPYAQYLDLYMPNKLNIERYLIDLASAASQAGFRVSKFIPVAGSSPAVYQISTVFDGNGNLPALIKNIEDLKRITSVQDATYESKDTGAEVTMNIIIYSTETAEQ